MISSEEHVVEKWGNLVPSARVTPPTNVSCSSSPAVLSYRDNNSDRMSKTAGIQYQFVRKIQRADVFYLQLCEITTLSSPLHRFKGEEEKVGMIHPCCAALLSSSGGQSCQKVVNLRQRGRLFVWILFRLTSQACAGCPWVLMRS